MFELQDLRVFLSVAQLGSITKAANELGYVQPNVSSKIKKLEQHLGFPLFLRKRNGVTLTPPGKAFFNYAKKILSLCNEAERSMKGISLPSGELNIGSMETTSYVRLPNLLNKFHQTYPQVQLNIQTGTTEDLIKKTLSYEIDGALVADSVNNPFLVETSVFLERLVLISSSSKHPLQQNGVTLLAFKVGCYYREIMEGVMGENSVYIRNIINLDSPQAILKCVEMGFGISLVPKSMVASNPNIYCHDIDSHCADVFTKFIYRKSSSMSIPLLRFIELLNSNKGLQDKCIN